MSEPTDNVTRFPSKDHVKAAAPVSELRPGVPSYLDIPGRLRQIADMVEKGAVVQGMNFGEVNCALLVLDNGQAPHPALLQFGRLTSTHERAGLLMDGARIAILEGERHD